MQTETQRPFAGDPAERRSAKRKSIMMRMDIAISPQQILSGHAVDLSIGGLGFFSPQQLNCGHVLDVRLPFSIFGQERELNLRGEVCYCTRTAPGEHRVGLRFVRLDEATLSFINAVCE